MKALKNECDLTLLFLPVNVTKIKMVEHDDVLKLISENNKIFYVTIIIVIIVSLNCPIK